MHLTLLLALLSTSPSDWPQYNGPGHDRSIVEGPATWASDWSKAGWQADTPGGFSSFAIHGDAVYTLITANGGEACRALDRANGETLWTTRLGSVEYDGGGGRGTEENSGGDGPRSTPTIAGGRVYTFDANLAVHCLGAETGAVLWKRDLAKEHDGQSLRWQNAASPVIEDGRVFVAGGGSGETFLALDAASGEVLWATGDESITHATPILATLHGTRQLIHLVQSGLVALDPGTGQELWRAGFDYRVSTAASPVVWGDLVYVSAGYGVGAGVYRVSKDGDRFSSESAWRKRNKLINHWSTPVCKDGFLYGMFSFKDYGDGPLQCVELATGEIMWSQDGFGPGNCIRVGERIVALSDAGDVVLVEATPEAYRELDRASVLEGKCWSMPTYSDGSLFVRSTREGKRLDLR